LLLFLYKLKAGVTMVLEEIKRNQLGLPFINTLKNYSFSKARSDLYAALIVTFLAIPQSMAGAIIVGVNPLYGLLATINAAITGSIFGNDPHLISGPSATVSVVIAGILFQMQNMGYSTVIVLFYLGLLVGIIQIIFALVRLGNISKFISLSVMSGFITGSAIVIIGDQLPTLLGIAKYNHPQFFTRMIQLTADVLVSNKLSYYPLLLGLATTFTILFLRLIPAKIPAILSAVLLFTGISYLFGLDSLPGIEVVGTFAKQLPAMKLNIPKPEFFAEIFGPALALSLLSSVQGLTIAKSLSIQTSQPLEENQELLALGAANFLCGPTRGFPISGSFTRSYLNYSAGGQTKMTGVFIGLIMILILIMFYPLLSYLPYPVLAGLIIVVAIDIIDFDQISVVVTTTRRDQIVFLGTIFSVIMLTLDQAIYLGMIVSLILHVRKASRLDMKELVVDNEGNLKTIDEIGERTNPRIAFIDVIGEAFFGSADLIKYRINQLTNKSPELKIIVLRMKNAMNLDITGAMALKEIARNLRKNNRTLMICGATPHIQKTLVDSGAAKAIGRDKILVAQKSMLKSTRQAINRAQYHIKHVVDGEQKHAEESPPLKHTMARKKNMIQLAGEEPITEEKTGYHENYDREG